MKRFGMRCVVDELKACAILLALALLLLVQSATVRAELLLGEIRGTILSGDLLQRFNLQDYTFTSLVGRDFAVEFSVDSDSWLVGEKSFAFPTFTFSDFDITGARLYEPGTPELAKAHSYATPAQSILYLNNRANATDPIYTGMQLAYPQYANEYHSPRQGDSTGRYNSGLSLQMLSVTDGTRPRISYVVDDAGPKKLAGMSSIGTMRSQFDPPYPDPYPRDIANIAWTHSYNGDTQIYSKTLSVQLVVESFWLGDTWTFKELAIATDAAYRNSLSGIIRQAAGEFRNAVLGSLRVAIFRRGNEVLFSIRGTEDLSNLKSDLSWGLERPNAKLVEYVAAAADLARDEIARNANARITFTGHSLGGAIAQVLGRASGGETTVFNAPGTEQWDLSEFRNLQGLTSGRSGGITSYRIQGDLVSQAGLLSAEAKVYTLPNKLGVIDEKDGGKAVSNWLASHDRTQFLQQIDAEPIRYGLDARVPINSLKYSATIENPHGVKFSIIGLVSDVADFYIDPPSLSAMSLVLGDSSPLLSAMLLPSLAVGNYYEIETLGETWLFLTRSGGGDWLTLSDAVRGFRFSVWRDGGGAGSLDGTFFAGLRFAAPGVLSADLSGDFAVLSVPEPHTYHLFVVGCLMLAFCARNSRIRSLPRFSQSVLQTSGS